MWIRLASVALCLVGGAAHAQSASESISGLESCIETARFADAICSKLPKDPTQRADCFEKARTAQLECLDRVLAKTSTLSAPPENSSETARPAPETTRPAPPVDTAPAQASPERPASKQAGRTDRPEGGTPAHAAAKPSNALAKSAPASVAAPAAEAPTGAIGSNSSGKNNDKPARVADWIVSETTSPVDYSPLVIAAVRAKSDVKDGPNALAVRCRARHTELSIRTDGAWGAPSGNDLLVDYQINDHPVVRQPWMLSADGKTATYKYDPVELLRSMPEGATLKVAVADKGNVRREATFELAGLSGVREKVGTACKWVPMTANTSSEKR
jgi:hypothetical protein